MRKLIALSIILICAGLIAFSFHNVAQENVIEEGFARENGKWQITRSDFRRGENLSVGFIPGPNWGWPPHDNTEIDGVAFNRVKVFYIKVTDPVTGNYTEFGIILVMPPAPYPPEDITAHPKIEVTHHGALTVEDYPREIGGIVEHDGTYVVDTSLYPDFVMNVTPENKTEILAPDPPSELRLYRVISETTYPYASLFAAGPATMVVGVVTLAWSIQRDKNRAIHRKNPVVNVKKSVERTDKTKQVFMKLNSPHSKNRQKFRPESSIDWS
jgi:hypothetical protein